MEDSGKLETAQRSSELDEDGDGCLLRFGHDDQDETSTFHEEKSAVTFV